MKEMMKKVKERREGFTMAELLIVVAIIAVLVAIAIPVFNSQLEKSRQGADAANCRAVYAEAMVNFMDSSAATKTGTATTDNVMQSASWDKLDASTKIGESALTDISKTKNATMTCTITEGNDGAITVTWAAGTAPSGN